MYGDEWGKFNTKCYNAEVTADACLANVQVLILQYYECKVFIVGAGVTKSADSLISASGVRGAGAAAGQGRHLHRRQGEAGEGLGGGRREGVRQRGAEVADET